jgi:hypothetical protein
MPNFVLVYHGGATAQSEDEIKEQMEKWMAWFGALGEAIVDGGHPFGGSKTVSSNGVSDGARSDPATGYSIVSADSLDRAVEMANGCPIVEGGGRIAVYEAMPIG